MDVNQTRFHLVYGAQDWNPAQAAASPSVEPLFDWNPCDATLSLHEELFVFPRLPGQTPLMIENRRGAARDRYGNWYWIAPDRTELRFLSMEYKASAEHFWSSSDQVYNCAVMGEFFAASAPPAPSELRFSGLAITPDHYLVVGMIQPQGLLVFDLYSGGPPSRILWPATVPFDPFDMAATADRGVVILDRANKFYWKLDNQLRVQNLGPAEAAPLAASAFQPVSGNLPQQGCIPPGQITQAAAASLTAITDPVAIECLPDGSVVILDNPPGGYYSLVHRFTGSVETGTPVVLAQALAAYVPDASTADDPFPQAVRGYAFAFTTTTTQLNAVGTLYIEQIYGDQTFAFDVSLAGNALSLSPQPRYFPMRQPEGKGLVQAGGNIFYDYQERWVPLAEQPRATYELSAQLVLPQAAAPASPAAAPNAFDGKLPACVWHRLFLDACIPPGASVQVESRAADLASLLPSTPWQSEPKPYLRDNGPEIAFFKPQLQGQADRTGTWELLFQNARGRYLQVRLTLTGNGRSSPRLQALRIYYPRFSYLRQYLPAVYQDDPISASFLDRYLANVEGFYTVLEDKIAAVQELFDARTIPAVYLDWLASWMSLVLDPTWSEQTRRLVLLHAPQMLRERGTPSGIIRAIRLMLDASPDDSIFAAPTSACSNCSSSDIFSVRVVEHFLTRSSPNLNATDVTQLQTPGTIASASISADSSSWTPAQGPEPLNQTFRCYLQGQYATIAALNTAWGTNYSSFSDSTLVLPPVQPQSAGQAQDWSRFLRDGLGFTYAPVTSADQNAYQAFLAQTYSTIGDLNAAWNLAGASLYSSFASTPLPGSMPSGGQRLLDWIKFVSVALPAQQEAHQFTVLVPVTLTDTPATQTTKLAVAQGIAENEKPAHTSFDVKLYWALFCAGEARLGQDTLLGSGSRFAALVLGSGGLAAGTLAPTVPILQRDRQPLGGDPLLQRCCEVKPQERCV